MLAIFDERIERNLTGIDAVLQELRAPPGYLNVGFPLYFVGNDDTTAVHRTFRKSYPAAFNARAMRDMNCTDLTDYVFSRLRSTGLDEIIRRYLGMRSLYTSPAACHIRKIGLPPNGQTIREAERGFEFHQDNKLYRLEREMLTLWFPFRYEHGRMASLEFLPRRFEGFVPTVTECGIDRDAYRPEEFWRPAYELGDAVLISGYNPHRTYYPEGVCKERTSIDMRFIPKRLPRPIYARPLGHRIRTFIASMAG